MEKSSKSYAVAMCLSGVFGLIGIHHFYLGNYVHGAIDFTMFVIGFSLVFIANDPALALLGVLIVLIDLIHTIAVTFLLIIGRCRDGEGKLVTYPGQQIPDSF